MESSSPSPSSSPPDAAEAAGGNSAVVSTSSGGGANVNGNGDGACEPGKLFIGGIPFDTTEEALREYFGKYGEVTEAIIMKDRGTGHNRGFGFVSFSELSSADRAIQDTTVKHSIFGRPVEVKRAIPRGEQQNFHNHHNGYQHHTRILSKGNGRTTTDGSQTKTKKIFVGGLSANLTQEEFKSYFEKFGKVTDVVVMIDSTTQRPRGFGFVTFESEESVNDAVQNTFQTLNGKTMEVKRAVPREGNNDNNNGNRNTPNKGVYSSRVSDERESIHVSYHGGVYPPYSPKFSGGFQGYGAPPYPPYAYGMGGYSEGYTFSRYGVGYASPYASLRGAWNGYEYVGARQGPLPYAATCFYPEYLNGAINPYLGLEAGGYLSYAPSVNRKWSQSESDSQLQAVNGTTASQVEDGKLDE